MFTFKMKIVCGFEHKENIKHEEKLTAWRKLGEREGVCLWKPFSLLDIQQTQVGVLVASPLSASQPQFIPVSLLDDFPWSHFWMIFPVFLTIV